MNILPYTHLEINVPNLLHNLSYFRSFLPAESKLLVLVKAYAYGHGSGEFAKILEDNGVDYLAVAYPEEGVAIRQYGVKLPIIVLSGGEANYPTLFQYNLGPSIPTFQALERYLQEASQAGVTEAPFHIKIDTGMHRLGFEPAQMPELAARLRDLYAHKDVLPIRVASVFTHFTGSAEPAYDDFTRHQIALYRTCSQQLLDVLPYRPLRHMLNSPGIERFAAEAAFDMSRLGIGLYGISSVDPTRLRPTAYLKTPVLQVKTVPQGDTIGYSRQGIAKNGPMKTATLAIGYADGINRHLGCGHVRFMVNGQLAPTVGNICMDMCMLDVTGIEVKAGDMVTIFGDNPTISQLADILGTIPYEILTSVNHRVPRVYCR